MKSFKKYIAEAYESGPNGGYGLPSDSTGRVATDDLHRFSEDAEVLQRLNAFIGGVADREFISVGAALEQLGRKVEQVGIEFDTILDEGSEDTGTADLPLSQFGGRFG